MTELNSMISRKILSFVLLLIVLQAGYAFVSVNMRPLQGTEIMELYPCEIGKFVTSIENDGNDLVEDVHIKWESAEGLVIIGTLQGFNTGNSRTTVAENIEPGGEKNIELGVKPVSLRQAEEAQKLAVSVAWGTKTYDYYSGTYVRVIPSPLEIDASLKSKVMKPGESNQVSLSVKNVSQENIRIENARLILPKDLYTDANSVLYETELVPGQEMGNRNFSFNCDPSFVGTTGLILRVSFWDSRGYHVIDKSFSIESRGLDIGLIALVGIVVLLIALVIYSKRRQEKG